MGSGGYNGGGTIVHAGSGFFSHKGGPGRVHKPKDGRDTPGPAPANSICDFSGVRPRSVLPKPTAKLLKPTRPRKSGVEIVRALRENAGGALKNERARITYLANELIAARARESQLDAAFRRATAFLNRHDIASLTPKAVDAEIDNIRKLIPVGKGPKRK